MHRNTVFATQKRTPKTAAAFLRIWRIDAGTRMRRSESIYVSIPLLSVVTIYTNMSNDAYFER